MALFRYYFALYRHYVGIFWLYVGTLLPFLGKVWYPEQCSMQYVSKKKYGYNLYSMGAHYTVSGFNMVLSWLYMVLIQQCVYYYLGTILHYLFRDYI